MNELYYSVIEQIEFFGAGNITKFDEIFRKSLKYKKVELDEISFFRYIYFDFLIGIGVIEPFYENDVLKWKFLERVNVLNISGRIYELHEEDNNDDSMKFVNASRSIFPTARVLDCVNSEQDFLDKVLDLKLEWNGLLDGIERKIDHVEISKYVAEQFNISNSKWEQVDKFSDEYSLYRLRGSFNKTIFIKGVKGEFCKILNSDWAILLFCRDAGIPLIKMFEVNNENKKIRIPWKFKTPAIVKRMFMHLDGGASYGKKGITYNFKCEDKLNVMLKLIGEKV